MLRMTSFSASWFVARTSIVFTEAVTFERMICTCAIFTIYSGLTRRTVQTCPARVTAYKLEMELYFQNQDGFRFYRTLYCTDYNVLLI